MSDFRTYKLPELETCELSDNVVINSVSDNKTYKQSLSSVLAGGQLKSGMIKTGYVTMADNPKCYPLLIDADGNGYSKIEWFDTVISSMEYDESSQSLIIKMNNPDIMDIVIPVRDLVNKYYPDNVTISSHNNCFGVIEGTLAYNGDYISACSDQDSEQYKVMRMIDGTPKQRNVVNYVYCVETTTDYDITRKSSEMTILDYRDKSNPMIDYFDDEGLNKRETLTSYRQLQDDSKGIDVRVGEMLYNKETHKLWYLKSTDIRSMTQLDENIVKVTLTAYPESYGTTTGSGVYDQSSDVSVYASNNFGYKFTRWSDGNTDINRKVNTDKSSSLTAYFDKDIIITYYSNY